VLEFTGERVVPGQVDPDLWNEHFARYLFAGRLARRKRVLDIGCGTGYGAVELAKSAAWVVALDVSPEAAAAAQAASAAQNVACLAASADAIPLASGSFDLITCFEVIEHLNTWPALLAEAHRLLAPGGQFIVSTPNKLYYAESRQEIGPNPYHVHEFDYEEFKAALSATFPSLTLYVQNHVGAVSFQPVTAAAGQSPEINVDTLPIIPEDSHFFVAVCAASPQTGAPSFLHVPATSNVLRERESHIAKLLHEIKLKNTWLEDLQRDLTTLLAAHRAQDAELKNAQNWAQSAQLQYEQSRVDLHETLVRCEAEQQAAGRAIESLRNELKTERETASQIIESLRQELTAAQQQLGEKSAQLNSEREEVHRLRGVLTGVRDSRWLKIGRRVNLGPDLTNF
jgi:SAM-dependent methyltransferase